MSTNGKAFDLLPITKLFAVVKNDLKNLDEEGLIDEGRLIKVIMACNERLGLFVREVKQCIITVNEYKAKLPLNFEKLFYTCALKATNAGITPLTYTFRDPGDNSFDADVIYDARIDRQTIAGTNNYQVTIQRLYNAQVTEHNNWVELSVAPMSSHHCFTGCPNLKNQNHRSVIIHDDGTLETPFRKGELYIMYVANMQDEEGSLLFPFHPLITPYYEWCLKEKVLMDAIFNSEGNYSELLKLAQIERGKAWIDAWNTSTTREYNEYTKLQKKKELEFYNQYFKKIL